MGTIYFAQSEDIVRQAASLPWVSFNSDEASLAPEGVFLESNAHPRAYGSFARVLARYVRDEQVLKDGEHTGATPGRVVRGPGWVQP